MSLVGHQVKVLLRGGFTVSGRITSVNQHTRSLSIQHVVFHGRTGNIPTSDSMTIRASIILDLEVSSPQPSSSSSSPPEAGAAPAKPPPRAVSVEVPEGTLIDSPEAFRVALEEIEKCEVIAVDCEGVDLGREGSVTLIQLGLPKRIFLVDVLRLGKATFEGKFKEILESQDHVKIMFDCRKDSDALFHLHNVRLQNVFDCQVADILIRRNMTGMMPGFVQGISRCLKAYLTLPDDAIQAKFEGRLLMEDPDVWAKRPLSAPLLKYAAFDVAHLHRLREIMMELLSFEYNVAVEKYLSVCRDDGHDSQHIIPEFESDILRYLFRNLRGGRPKRDRDDASEKRDERKGGR